MFIYMTVMHSKKDMEKIGEIIGKEILKNKYYKVILSGFICFNFLLVRLFFIQIFKLFLC